MACDVIILDESLAALDPENMARALRCLRARAGSLIVIAHPCARRLRAQRARGRRPCNSAGVGSRILAQGLLDATMMIPRTNTPSRAVRMLAVGVAVAAPSVAGALPFVQTVGLEHELKTEYYSIVTDDDVTATQTQVIAATDAQRTKTGRDDIKDLSLACYHHGTIRVFCLTNDDGNVLEIVGDPWPRDAYADRARMMEYGLAAFNDVITRLCPDPKKEARPDDERVARWVKQGDPIFTKAGNTWGRAPSRFREQDGCIVSLKHLIHDLTKYFDKPPGNRRFWSVEADPDLLDHVFVFRATTLPSDRTRVSNTQVNVTVPLARFSDPGFASMFSTMDTPDRLGRLRIGARLWQASVGDEYRIGAKGDLRTPVAAGLKNLINYNAGVYSLWKLGVGFDPANPNLHQGQHKNSQGLYLKSPLHDVIAKVLSTFGPEDGYRLEAAIEQSKLSCDPECERAARAMWNEVLDPANRPIDNAGWADVMARWRTGFVADVKTALKARSIGYIHNRWGPVVTDDDVVVLVEMRDQDYDVNVTYSLNMENAKFVLDRAADIPAVVRHTRN